MYTVRSSIYTLYLLWVLSPCVAQQYPVRMYTNHDGLAQMQVMSVFADSRGLLWVGTKWGVSRFNGQQFTNLPPRVLRGIEFNHITEDRLHNLWFTQGNGRGTTRYDGHSAHLYPTMPFPACFDHQNRGWTMNAQKRLAYLWQDSLYTADRLIPQLRNRGVLELAYNQPKRHLLIRTEQGSLLRYNGKQLDSIPLGSPLGGIIKNPHSIHLTTLPDHYIVGTYPKGINGLYVYHWYNGATLVPFLECDTGSGKLRFLRSLPADYVLTMDGQTYRVERNTKQLQLLTTSQATPCPIARLGNQLFVGTEQGLCRLIDTGFRHFDREQAPYVWSVAEDRKGHMWWINYRQPIRVWDGQTVKTRTDYTLTNHEWYYGSRRGQDGHLYLSHAEGVVRYDGNQFSLMRSGKPNESNITWTLSEDTRRGWLLQGTDGRVTVFQRGQAIRQISPAGDSIPDLGSYCAIGQSKQGHYWLGGAKGFCSYNPDTRQIKAYTHALNRFPRTLVTGLSEDSTGTLWIASHKGLAYLDRQTDSVRFIAQSYFQSPIQYFGVAGNYLIAGDLQGLHIMDLGLFHRTGRVKIKGFNQHNGFMGIEPGQNGFYHDSKNRVWIPSGSVLSYLDMRQLKLTSDPLQANIYALNDSLLTFAYRPDSALNLLYGQRTVKMSCEAIGFDRAEQTQFRYRLDSNSWSDWLTTPDIYLNDLKNGLHQFHLEARRNSLADEPPALTSVQFRVRLPFWRWSSFSYFALLFLAGGLGFVGFLTYRDRRNTLRLQRQEQQLLFLQVQTLQAQLNPHFVFNVLGTIQDMIMNDDRHEANRNLIRLAQLIRSFLESSIHSELPSKSRSADLEMPLAKELELIQLYLEFERLQYRDRFTYTIDVDPHIEPTVWSIPPMLVQPFVENAIKHGLLNRDTPGHLWLRIRPGLDDALLIDIEDNGVGRSEAKRQQEASIRAYVSRGSGLVERRIRVLNTMGYRIDLTITDPPAGGTLVRLLINTNGH